MSPEDETLEVVEKPKRARQKRVATTVESSEAEVIPVPKKRTPRKKVTPPSEVLNEEKKPPARRTRTPRVDAAPERKAPTPIAAHKAATKSLRRQLVVVMTLISLGVGASAGVGFTDKGSIDVNKTISERNDKITRGEVQGEILPVQNTNKLPDGGLVELGINGPEATSTQNNQAAMASSTTATSSQPVGQVPMTAAEAQAAALARGQNSSSTEQSQ